MSEGRLHKPGSYEHTYTWLYPNVEEQTRSQAAHIHPPRISFRTDDPPVRAFLRMLRMLGRSEFKWVTRFSGPPVALEMPKRGTVPVEDLMEALKGKAQGPVPLLGLRATLVYKPDQKVLAKLRVSGGARPRVRLRIRGAMLKVDWNTLRKRLVKKFQVQA